MAISIVQSIAETGSGGGDTVSCTWPTTTTAGSLLIAVLTNNNGRSISSVPSGWTFLYSETGDATSSSYYVYYINNAAARSGAESFVLASGARKTLVLYEIAGYNTSDPFGSVAYDNAGYSLPSIDLSIVAGEYNFEFKAIMTDGAAVKIEKGIITIEESGIKDNT